MALWRGRSYPFVLFGVAMLVDCRGATNIRITTYSEVECARNARVAFAIAHDVAGLRDVAPASYSTKCTPAAPPFGGLNDTGTVVVAPASADDAFVSVAFMTRPDGESPESCLDPKEGPRCIVARRQLRFFPHEETSLAVELRLSCLGVVCPSDQTCRKGVCVDARVPQECVACGEETLATSAPLCGDTGALQAGAPWPVSGFCPTRPGRSGRNGPRTPSVRWTFPTGDVASMDPAVGADGTIYVGSNAKFAIAVNPDGTERWRARVGNNINGSGFVIGKDGRVFVGAADGRVYAFAADGTPAWSQQVGIDVALPFAPGSDGTLFVAALAIGGPQPLVALAPGDGAIRWRSTVDFGVGAVATGKDGNLVLGGVDSRLHALRPADGAAVWTADTSGLPSTPSVGDDGTIYVVASGTLRAFAPGGAPRWQLAIGEDASGVALGTDTVFVGTPSGLHAVSFAGALRWKLPLANVGFRPGIVGGDGTVYIGGESGLHAVSSAGVLLWSVPFKGAARSQPALGADGTLYITSSDGNLYAIGP